MEQQQASGEAAADLMSQFINSGVVQQTEEDSFVVHGANGDQEFKVGNDHNGQ